MRKARQISDHTFVVSDCSILEALNVPLWVCLMLSSSCMRKCRHIETETKVAGQFTAHKKHASMAVIENIFLFGSIVDTVMRLQGTKIPLFSPWAPFLRNNQSSYTVDNMSFHKKFGCTTTFQISTAEVFVLITVTTMNFVLLPTNALNVLVDQHHAGFPACTFTATPWSWVSCWSLGLRHLGRQTKTWHGPNLSPCSTVQKTHHVHWSSVNSNILFTLVTDADAMKLHHTCKWAVPIQTSVASSQCCCCRIGANCEGNPVHVQQQINIHGLSHNECSKPQQNVAGALLSCDTGTVEKAAGMSFLSGGGRNKQVHSSFWWWFKHVADVIQTGVHQATKPFFRVSDFSSIFSLWISSFASNSVPPNEWIQCIDHTVRINKQTMHQPPHLTNSNTNTNYIQLVHPIANSSQPPLSSYHWATITS